jgi:hypothetical protein
MGEGGISSDNDDDDDDNDNGDDLITMRSAWGTPSFPPEYSATSTRTSSAKSEENCTAPHCAKRAASSPCTEGPHAIMSPMTTPSSQHFLLRAYGRMQRWTILGSHQQSRIVFRCYGCTALVCGTESSIDRTHLEHQRPELLEAVVQHQVQHQTQAH